MAEFNLNDMEEARRRVMEMQRRSQSYTGGTRRSSDPPQNGKHSPEPMSGGKYAAPTPPHASQGGKHTAQADPGRAVHADQSAPPSAVQPSETICAQEAKPPATSQNDPSAGLLNIGGLGSDRTLILLLLVLLWGENTDRLLMLALLYCAL